MAGQRVQVALKCDIEEGTMTSVLAGNEQILLARVGDRFYAISNICTHFYTLLSNGELDADRCEVQCPLHDSRFSLLTGEPTELPADKPVRVFSVEVEGDAVFVQI